MFITKIKQAGMQRARLPERERKNFYLYVDEFHNVVTETFENLLSEARKYGLAITIAHQYMGQLLPKVQAAVLGNVGSMIIFRLGGEDARILESEMAPIFKMKDMINLGMQEFYVKLLIDGQSYDPFSAQTLQVMPPAHQSYRIRIIEASRRKYAVTHEAARRLIAEEEQLVVRNPQERAALEGKKAQVEEAKNPELLI